MWQFQDSFKILCGAPHHKLRLHCKPVYTSRDRDEEWDRYKDVRAVATRNFKGGLGMKLKRYKLFVDKGVQGALMRRVATYWIVSSWGIFCVLAGFPIGVTLAIGVTEGPTIGSLLYQSWLDFWPSMIASLLVLPVIIWDLLRLSHRFVGPMIRLRNAMRDLADGKSVRPITFREGDFWCEFASEFNRIAARLEEVTPATEAEQTPSAEAEETIAV